MKTNSVFIRPLTNRNDNIQWSILSRTISQRESIIQCLYSATSGHTERSDMDHICKLHHACLLFRKRSPDGATPKWGGRHLIDIWLELTTYLWTPKGWKAELARSVDLQRMVYPHKWLPSAAGRAQDREVRRPKDRRSIVTAVPRNQPAEPPTVRHAAVISFQFWSTVSWILRTCSTDVRTKKTSAIRTATA